MRINMNKSPAMQRSSRWKLPMLGSLALCFAASAAEVYVSPQGNDRNPGTKEKPVASLSRARDVVRPMAGKKPVRVNVADGVYYLPETLVFEAADSGTSKRPILYKAENEGGAVLSGGVTASCMGQQSVTAIISFICEQTRQTAMPSLRTGSRATETIACTLSYNTVNMRKRLHGSPLSTSDVPGMPLSLQIFALSSRTTPDPITFLPPTIRTRCTHH